MLNFVLIESVRDLTRYDEKRGCYVLYGQPAHLEGGLNLQISGHILHVDMLVADLCI